MLRSSEFERKGREVIQLFPDLERGRNFFIQLFESETSLVVLGYTQQQILVTKPVLDTLETEGEIRYVRIGAKGKKVPVFCAGDDQYSIEIVSLPESQGYRLVGFNYEKGQRIASFLDEDSQDLIAKFVRGEPLSQDIERLGADPLFELGAKVADIYLLKEEELDLNDLSSLIKTIYYSEETKISGRPAKKSVFSILGKVLGLVAPFEAAWVDEESKDEFIIRIEDRERTEPLLHHWKKLWFLEDEQGRVIPIGRKPNTLPLEIAELLEERETRDARRIRTVPRRVMI